MTELFDDTQLYPLLAAGDIDGLLKHVKHTGIDSRDRDGRSLLSTSVTENQMALIDCNADVNISDYKGLTALHLAAIQDMSEFARKLLTLGADVDPQYAWGNTPLWRAAMNDSLNAVTILREAGAKLDVQNKHGVSPRDLLS